MQVVNLWKENYLRHYLAAPAHDNFAMPQVRLHIPVVQNSKKGKWRLEFYTLS